MHIKVGRKPLVAASEAKMWVANQAERSKPYSGTMKTGSQVVAITLPPPMSTTPTSTPCWGPTKTFLDFLPKRGRMRWSKISGEILPMSGNLLVIRVVECGQKYMNQTFNVKQLVNNRQKLWT